MPREHLLLLDKLFIYIFIASPYELIYPFEKYAVTDEIPCDALSYSPLIEILNPEEEF